jgi:predicted nuclease of predicted toxin-antitoxin system
MVQLLLDENLSQRLLPALAAAYPGSSQVLIAGLSGADDLTVWHHARQHGFVLVTKDDDFQHLAALHGPPPVVVRLAFGNCSNARVVEALLAHNAAIEAAIAQGDVALIELG